MFKIQLQGASIRGGGALLQRQPGRTVASQINLDAICIQIKARANCQQNGIKNIYGSYWHDVCVSQVMETEY